MRSKSAYVLYLVCVFYVRQYCDARSFHKLLSSDPYHKYAGKYIIVNTKCHDCLVGKQTNRKICIGI